jgi:pilus assembly protein CpaB
MTRKPVALLAAVVLALVGTILLVTYVHSAKDHAVAGEQLVPVLVLTDDVAAGTKSSDLASHVKTEQVPAKVKAAGAVTSISELNGTVASVSLIKGEQLVNTRFAAVAASGRAPAPDGLLEVTIPLDPQRALGGQLVAGNKVGVVITIDDDGNGKAVTHMVLQKVLVTSVQQPVDTSNSSGNSDSKDAKTAPTGTMMVTLAIDAPSVEKVVYAAEHGHIWLASEPDAANTAGTSIQNRDSVLR